MAYTECSACSEGEGIEGRREKGRVMDAHLPHYTTYEEGESRDRVSVSSSTNARVSSLLRGVCEGV